MKILKEEAFKTTIDGKQTGLYTLKNKNGVVVQITNFGGKIAAIFVPDRNGKMDDIVLGYETIQEWIKGNTYFGAICGRYANRIAKGKFVIDNKEYSLALNNGPNALHGGIKGFNDVVWDVVKSNDFQLELKYVSKDGEEGYPGNLTVKVIYTLTDLNELKIEYFGTTDKPTVVNLTSHSFFNLAGEGNGDILNHELMINADNTTPVDEVQIPTGEIVSVKGTPMDFTKSTVVGDRIDDDYDQLKYGKGYDHNWVLNHKPGVVALAAVYYDPQSGRVMEIHTDQPGVQLYTGNWLDGSDKGKGHVYGMRSALCLETQKFPDSPNKPQFPSTLLKPGETYKHVCIHKFSLK